MKKPLFTRANYPLALGLVVALVSAMGFSEVTQAETPATPSSDEQILRELIHQQSEGNQQVKYTDDAVFVSGRYPRPLVGRQQREEARASTEAADPRSNFQTTTQIVRLVVADSKDLAYEFSNGALSFDDAQKKHVSVETSLLRVWRKEGGEWKVAAFFARPNEPN